MPSWKQTLSPELYVIDALADLAHHAGRFEPQGERKSRLVADAGRPGRPGLVDAGSEIDVLEIDADVRNPDDDLARRRRGHGQVGHFHDLRAAEPIDDYRFHECLHCAAGWDNFRVPGRFAVFLN